MALALPSRAESEPQTLACEFSAGQTTTYGDGAFTSRAAAPLNFLIVDINLDQQTAKISTGAAGTMGQLRIIRAINANHYLEVLNEGFLSLTTVFDADAKGNRPALMTRHVGVLGQPMATQYSGICRER